MNAMPRRGATIVPNHAQMRIRIGMAVAVLLCSIVVSAQPAQWEADATPSHPRLPKVRVVLGEPGYVSTRNTPIVIHATAGAPFDGYIGVHFEVEGRKTLDVPVVARAELGKGERWTFRTWIQLEGWAWRHQTVLNRELAVEWRDRSMRVLGSTVAGTPPWSHPRPLRVVASAGEKADNCCFGVEPHVRSTSELSDTAQWYSGFREIVIETSLWLDLPSGVKSAAFSSGAPIVFVGPPRAGQSLNDLDRTLIPVELTSSTGEYETRWPWHGDGARLTTAIGWRPKPGARVVGDGAMPYLVSSGRAVFVADSLALTSPLPVMLAERRGRLSSRVPVVRTRFGAVVRDRLPLVAAIGVLLLCGALAFALTRSPRIAVLAVSLLVTVGLLASRDQIRPRVGVSLIEESIPVAPGVIRHVINVREHGPTPIPARVSTLTDPHLWVSRRGNVRQEAELRTSDTPPGYGAMFLRPDHGPWDSTARWMSRDEVGEPVQVTIRHRDGEKLTFQYAAPFAPDYAQAMWQWSGVTHQGDVCLERSARGEASVTSGQLLRELQDIEASAMMKGDVRIRFVRIERDKTTLSGWESPHIEAGDHSTNLLFGTLYLQADGTLRRYFAVPSSTGPLRVSIRTGETLRRVMVAGPRETVALEPAGGGHNFFQLDPGTLRRVAERDVVELIVEPVMPAETYEASMSWKESR